MSHTSDKATGAGDHAPDTVSRPPDAAGGPGHARLSPSLIIVVSALVFAAFRQGAYYGPQFATVERLLGAAAIVALLSAIAAALPRWADRISNHRAGHRPHPIHLGVRMAAGWAPAPAVGAAVGLAVATTISGAMRHQLSAASPTLGILATAAVVASLVSSSSGKVQQTLLGGLVVVGVMVALTGWWGVAAHRWPWSLVDGGLWRAASTLTYANATAAVCVSLALVALSQLVVRRGPLWSLAATVLLTGAAATLSRAGALGFAVGVIVLSAQLGVVPLLIAAWPAVLGATVAAAGLATSFQAAPNGAIGPGHLGVAGAAGAVGLAVSLAGGLRPPQLRAAGQWPTATARQPAWRGRRGWSVALVVLVATAGAVAFARPAVRNDRFSIQSPDRTKAWQATWRLVESHPWTGVGPGPFAASWTGPDGEALTAQYTHNEYLQLTAQEGALGAGAMILGLGGIACLAWRRRPRCRRWAPTTELSRWAGGAAALSALALHSGFDFLWHIPLIPLLGAAFAGIVLSHPTRETAP
ncbi:MAG TPA: O-antigen ligase family protein [Acidimicrobiales bacterium]